MLNIIGSAFKYSRIEKESSWNSFDNATAVIAENRFGFSQLSEISIARHGSRGSCLCVAGCCGTPDRLVSSDVNCAQS
jgi:hypothetical protein